MNADVVLVQAARDALARVPEGPAAATAAYLADGRVVVGVDAGGSESAAVRCARDAGSLIAAAATVSRRKAHSVVELRVPVADALYDLSTYARRHASIAVGIMGSAVLARPLWELLSDHTQLPLENTRACKREFRGWDGADRPRACGDRPSARPRGGARGLLSSPYGRISTRVGSSDRAAPRAAQFALPTPYGAPVSRAASFLARVRGGHRVVRVCLHRHRPPGWSPSVATAPTVHTSSKALKRSETSSPA